MDNNYELGLKIALQRFGEEADRREALDTKASLVLGFAGVLAGLLFNVLSNILEQQPAMSMALAISLPLVSGFIIILSSVALSLAGLWIRDYRGGPGSKILVSASETNQGPDLQKKLLEVYANAFQHNWRQNQRKVVLLYASFSTIAAGTLLVFIALILFAIL